MRGKTKPNDNAQKKDGHAPETQGVTYAMLYLPQTWATDMMQRHGLPDVSALEAAFKNTLTDDPTLIFAIHQAFFAIHHHEGRLARDQSLDHLLSLLARHVVTRPASFSNDSLRQMYPLNDHLHDNMHLDIGLDELARHSGIDRFRLSRQFQIAFGLSTRLSGSTLTAHGTYLACHGK